MFTGCTGYFFSEMQVSDFTGWNYALDEGDVPVHDCQTADAG